MYVLRRRLPEQDPAPLSLSRLPSFEELCTDCSPLLLGDDVHGGAPSLPPFPSANLALDWANHLQQSVCSFVRQKGIVDEMKASLHARFHDVTLQLTTDFSGIGTSEHVLAELLRATHEAPEHWDLLLPRTLSMITHYASDKDEVCRAVLRQHTGDGRPQHIFSDMIERLPAQCVQQVHRLRDEATAKFEEQTLRSEGAKSDSQHRLAIGRKFMEEARC